MQTFCVLVVFDIPCLYAAFETLLLHVKPGEQCMLFFFSKVKVWKLPALLKMCNLNYNM